MQIDNRLDRTLSHVNLEFVIKQHRDDSWWNWHILMAARRKVHLSIKYLLLYQVPSNGIRTKVILFLEEYMFCTCVVYNIIEVIKY